jgi:hypothetical protein
MCWNWPWNDVLKVLKLYNNFLGCNLLIQIVATNLWLEDVWMLLIGLVKRLLTFMNASTINQLMISLGYDFLVSWIVGFDYASREARCYE